MARPKKQSFQDVITIDVPFLRKEVQWMEDVIYLYEDKYDEDMSVSEFIRFAVIDFKKRNPLPVK